LNLFKKLSLFLLIFLYTNLFALSKEENYTLTVKRNGILFSVPFIENGSVNVEGYKKLCYICADIKDGKAAQMDPNLFYILAKTQYYLYFNQNIKSAIEINSGYRTFHTNSRLEGAAKNSMHLHAKALDVKIQGVTPLQLAKIMRHFGARGIGIYDSHLHIDTWKIRAWLGKSS
jgi:uncharacterized protein YcbK (DUF882 family)